MKNRFLFILFFTSFFSIAQNIIKGTVYEANVALEGAAVYLNSTMLGTTTNADGEFSIPVKDGQFELIVSYLGFKKIIYSLNTENYNKPLVFKLIEEANMLNEIVITKTIYDDEWKHNLDFFKKQFIGRSKLAKGCEILNPKVLHFEFNAKDNILTAIARKPLLLKHKKLGYIITYELESFIKNKNYLTYLGYSRYKQIEGNKRKQKRWEKNRLKAYNGSSVHFFKSVLNNTIDEEGFIVHQFKRVPNPARPDEKTIKKAKELIKLHKNSINFSVKIEKPKTRLDSALVVVRKAKLSKYADYLYKSKLIKEEIITSNNNITTLSFNDNLSIVYTKEKEEMGYVMRNHFSKKRYPLSQTSSIIPLNKNIVIDKTGILVNPLDIYFEGYWSYEKFGDSLPLDYESSVSKQ